MQKIKLLVGSVGYTFINVGASLLPLFAAALYAGIIDGKETTMREFTGKGEVTIICIPLCITILFTLYHYKKEIGISKLADVIYFITFFWVAVAIGLYAYGIKGLGEPKSSLVVFSIIFFIWTFISMVISRLVEDSNLLGLKEQRKMEQESLESKFNKSRS